MDGLSAAEGPEVCGAGRATSDQGGSREMREPGVAIRTMVPGGAKGGRSQDGANWLTT